MYCKITIWNLLTRAHINELKAHTVDSSVYSVAFSPNGKILASGNRDNTIKIRNLKTEAPIIELKVHYYSIFSAAFYLDGKTLAIGGF